MAGADPCPPRPPAEAAADERRSLFRALLVIALIGIALRLAFSLGYWVDKELTRDEREYLSLARSLAAGEGFVYDAAIEEGPVDPFGRPPGYPAFLAIAGGAGRPMQSVPTLVKITQSGVGGIGVIFVGLLALRLAGPKAARAAAFVAAVYPPLVWISAYALSEAVFWPVALAVAWMLDRAYDGPREGVMGAASGVLGGVAVLIRPGMVLFFMIAAVWLLFRRRPLLVAALAVGSLLVIAPWSARNYVHYGRFVLVASNGGVNFWTGNNALALGEGDLAANPNIKRAQLALRAAHPGLSEEEMEPIYYREAFAWILANPGDWLLLEARKFFYLVVPDRPLLQVAFKTVPDCVTRFVWSAAPVRSGGIHSAGRPARAVARSVAASSIRRGGLPGVLCPGALPYSGHRPGARGRRRRPFAGPTKGSQLLEQGVALPATVSGRWCMTRN